MGVPGGGAAVVVVEAEAVGGDFGLSCFITRGTWKASRPRKRTPRTPATIFCFFCFALSGSTCFFAIRELLSPTRRWALPGWGSSLWSLRSSWC